MNAKITQISQYGFKTEADPNKWINYDKQYDGYKLTKGTEEGQIAEYETNEAGYVTKLAVSKDELVKHTAETKMNQPKKVPSFINEQKSLIRLI